MYTIEELAEELKKYDQKHTNSSHSVQEYKRSLLFLIESPLSLDDIRESCVSSNVDEDHTRRVVDLVEQMRIDSRRDSW